MPYKNIYLFEGQKLGSSFSEQDDPFKALSEGKNKAVQIARILAHQVKGVKPNQIEIQCWWYDPQYPLFPELAKKAGIEASSNGKKTLKSLQV